MKFKLGMRTIKTAVAVGLSVAVSYALRLEYPFYAAIACVVVLQIYSKDTVTAGRNRLLGTLAGGLTGSLFAYIPIDKSIISTLGILFLFFILSQLRLNKSMTIAGIVFMRVMVDLDYNQETPLLFTYNRMLATLIGVVIAVAVNLLLFPYHRTRDNDRRFILLKTHLAEAMQDLLAFHTPADLSALQKDCDVLHEHLVKNSAEYKLFARPDAQVNEMREAVDAYRSALRHMAMVQELPPQCWLLDTANTRRLASLLPDQDGRAAVESTDPIIIVYNYHVGRILDALEQSEKALFQPPRLWTPQIE